MNPQQDTSNIDPQQALGEAVRILRKKLGLRQEDLAERVSLPPSWLARVESGNHDPTWGDMRRLAEGLEVSLEELSELAEEIEGTWARPTSPEPSDPGSDG